MEGNWSVDNLESVEFTRARGHDSVDTESTDTVSVGAAGHDDLDGVGTWGEVDTSVGVVSRVVGVMSRDLVVSVMAVVTSDQGSLEDEVAIVVDGEGVSRAVQIGDAEDSWANSDKVKGLGNSASSLSKVELVPSTVNL